MPDKKKIEESVAETPKKCVRILDSNTRGLLHHCSPFVSFQMAVSAVALGNHLLRQRVGDVSLQEAHLLLQGSRPSWFVTWQVC